MSVFFSAKCDAVGCDGLKTARTFSIDVLARRILAAGWTIDDLGRTYCPEHPNGRA